ncbi:hypothetical protein [Paeniglutamicibacter sp.]|uniref:hypothetical protein n=1 Tax=Paeniglutamicibacter sp. TaxID=1934391 RepID=UPI003989CFA1
MSIPALDVFELNGRTTVRSSDGTFLRVQTPTGVPVPMLETFHGQIREQLEARATQRIHPRPGRESVALLGPATGWEPVSTALAGIDIQDLDYRGTPEAAHGLVVQVAATPTERGILDALPEAGTAVLRCYREGEILFVDPLALTPSDPGGSQVLRRRLAASAAADELDGWLDTARPADGTLDGLPALATQFLGARIRSMVAAWQYDTHELAALRRNLWRLDTRTLCSSEHPVLGFAEPAKSSGRRR